MWAALSEEISRQRGHAFRLTNTVSLSGGCINRAFRLEGEDGTRFFLKTNSADAVDMFAAEADALEAIEATQTIRVPVPITHGVTDGQAYLILEYIEFGDRRKGAEMGRQLARMHRHTAEQFGWHRDNTIGSTPQRNTQEGNWITFYREHRLRYQLDLARRNRLRITGGDRLLQNLDTFFEGHSPPPSLLHGDLWGGNAGFTKQGHPVLFDPASYYGDRETDLAMTELFGGFGPEFYRTYDEEWPRDPGYRQRIPLYNLYHILNHANLFGGGYAEQAQAMVDALLRGIA